MKGGKGCEHCDVALGYYWPEDMSGGGSSISGLQLATGNWNCGYGVGRGLLFAYVHGGIIDSDPKVETTQMSIDTWMDKQIVFVYTCVCTYNGIWPSHKKEWSPNTRCNMDEPQKYDAKSKKPDAKGHMSHDSVVMKFP